MIRARLWPFALLLCQCTTKSPVAPPVVRTPTRAEPEEAPESRSEFFVVAEGLDGVDGKPNNLHLSRTKGALFLYLPQLVYRDGVFVPSGASTAFGFSGEWPNDLWALRMPECQPPGRVDTPECRHGVEVLSWTKDRWTKQGFVEQDISGSFDVSLGAWTKQRALTFIDRIAIDNEGRETGPIHLVAVHGATPHPPLRASTMHGKRVDSVQIVGPDEVLVFGKDDSKKAFIERWLSDARVASLTPPDGAKVWASDWSHVLAFESNGQATLFDGTTWQPFPLPPESKVVFAYAREPSGREWLVVGDGTANSRNEPLATRVFARATGKDWALVPLPLPAFPGASNDLAIKVTDVHVVAEGNVWLSGWTAGDCKGRGVLLHNQRPKGVCFLSADARVCKAGPTKVDVDAAECQAVLQRRP